MVWTDNDMQNQQVNIGVSVKSKVVIAWLQVHTYQGVW